MDTTSPITEVTAATFDAEVVEASRTQPVVVDFWAPWCGPCHQLAPILERAAQRHAADVRVVKLNVDEAPGISQRYGIRGIPAVKAFRGGAVVSEFTGVQPDAAVETFFTGLVPTAADRLVAEAADAVHGQREGLLRQALEADPGHRDAVVGLATLLRDTEPEEARALLARVPADAQVRRLLAELDLGSVAEGEEGIEELRAAAAGGDAHAALRLGRVLAARGQHEEALRHLLDGVRDPAHREEGRAAVLAVFAVLGDDHDLVRATRPRLAAALF